MGIGVLVLVEGLGWVGVRLKMSDSSYIYYLRGITHFRALMQLHSFQFGAYTLIYVQISHP